MVKLHRLRCADPADRSGGARGSGDLRALSIGTRVAPAGLVKDIDPLTCVWESDSAEAVLVGRIVDMPAA